MKKSKLLKNKKFIVNDLDSLRKDFYKTYDPDYWLYKISLLKNCHDNYDSIKKIFTVDLEDIIDDDYKKMLRTEIHFLYFKMIETLFEIVFAVSEHDNRNLWLELSFSKNKRTYEKIKAFSENNISKFNLTRKIKTEIAGKKIEIDLLRWIFYFVYPSKMTGNEWKKNLENVRKLLEVFARDFSDRGEYNAYKHSLRFYNSSFALSIGLAGSQKMQMIGKSDDAITYLEEYKKKNQEGDLQSIGKIARTTKPFDFERDVRCCLIIHALIKNIIYTRKYTILNELHGKEFQFYTFLDIKFPEVVYAKTGVTKSSFTV